jgi:hypothetical protein
MHHWAPLVKYLPTAITLAEKAAGWYFNSKKLPSLV